MDPKDEIKSKIDIVELIGEYLTLKPGGGAGYKALCPFHSEKTPSFYVSADKQIWRCFGCGEGGDGFSFIQKIEGMDFPEALRHLGAKVGVEIKRFSSTEGNVRQRLSSANELAQKYYEKVLSDSPKAIAARSYLERRGIPPELRAQFGLGFAPDGWDHLASFLRGRGFSEGELVQAGLALKKKSGSGVIDRFRNRIMIPLRDQHGNTVGFTGRVLVSDDQGPKYMNSPETPLYHKGKILFGLDLAKLAIKQAKQVVVVEGNLDVIASHKAGVAHVVASSGTALTGDQLSLVKRYTDTVVFSFDQDAAGFTAAQRGIREARELGMNVRALVLPPDGKDPDEIVQKDPNRWRVIVQQTMPIMHYYIEQATRGRDVSNIDDKRAIGKFLLPEIAAIPDVIEREHWLSRVADLLRTDLAVLRGALPGYGTPVAQKPVVQPLAVRAKQTREEQAAHDILAGFLHFPSIRQVIESKLDPEVFPSSLLQDLYKKIKSAYTQVKSDQSAPQSLFTRVRADLALASEETPLLALLDEISLEGERFFANTPPATAQSHLVQSISVLRDTAKQSRKKALVRELRLAEQAGDHARVADLIQEFRLLD